MDKKCIKLVHSGKEYNLGCFKYTIQAYLTEALFIEKNGFDFVYNLDNKHQENIIKWGANRLLFAYSKDNEVKIIDEEIRELNEAKENNDIHEQIDALCDMYVVLTQTFAKAGLAGQKIEDDEWLQEMYNLYIKIPNEVESLGYSFDCAMEETIKEISSRVQDPKQKERWDNGDKEEAEKWQKWKEQPEDTKYKANYGKCKLNYTLDGNNFLSKRFMEIQ